MGGFCTVGHHGGLTNIGYWGNQHLGGANFFSGALETGWHKCFRFYVAVEEKNYYPELSDTQLFPFGLAGKFEAAGLRMNYDLLLLPDTLVQRVKINVNAHGKSFRVGLIHQEDINAVGGSNRTWQPFVFEKKYNAFIASCRDINPPPVVRPANEESLAQIDRGPELHDSPDVTTWIGLGCDVPFTVRGSYHARSKQYIRSEAFKKKEAAFYLVFANSRKELEKRLAKLKTSVHRECDELVAGYEKRLRERPQIDVGDPVLNSAFLQFPEMIHHMKVPDMPGAAKATLAGYWVWGWDGMMPLMPSPLSNEKDYSGDSYRFFHGTIDERFGIPHQFSTGWKLKLKGPFPSQCQFIASLYHYTAITGDLKVARDVFPTCQFILEKCRRDVVKDTGLVSGAALWPDYPEAMEEDGHDISSMNNSLLYQGLRAMEYLATALGRPAVAHDCREWARRLRVNFVRYLYDPEKGYFISSCSSIDFKPRKHYCCQAIFWLTPFARELVSHAPATIATFMDENLRAPKCLLSLPHWDTCWMADGNQLGSSYPAADYFYLNVHKLAGDDTALKNWTGDVKWYWQHHTAPEAWTPEAENEEIFGPDNWGGKQNQSCSTWYASLYIGMAGLDFDHEGLTLTPVGDRRITIGGLQLHGTPVDFKITGKGPHLAALKLNGKVLPAALHKISWKQLAGKHAKIEMVRTTRTPAQPVLVHADGLRVDLLEAKRGVLVALISGDITGEVVVRAPKPSKVLVDGEPAAGISYDSETGAFIIPFLEPGEMRLEVLA